MALHGHGQYGYDPVAGRDDLPGVAAAIKSANYDYGRQLVRRGYVVAVPCLTPFGRRLGKGDAYKKEDACAITFVRLQLLGKLLMAENLRDALWSLEVLARHDEVDAKRLGCVGLSYGGRMAMLTTAARAAHPGRGHLRAPERDAGARRRPLQLRGTGHSRTASVRRCAGDRLADRTTTMRLGGRLARWTGNSEMGGRGAGADAAGLQGAGAEEQLQVDRFEGGHEWSGRLGYPLLEKVLS